MDEGKLVDTVKNYMKEWMLIRQSGDMVIILPAVGKTSRLLS